MTPMAARPPRRCGSDFAGADHEIDLSSTNARAFRRQLAPFVEHARRPGRDWPAGQRAPQPPAGAATISGRGRKTTASRSASAGGSRRTSWSSTPLPADGQPDGLTITERVGHATVILAPIAETAEDDPTRILTATG